MDSSVSFDTNLLIRWILQDAPGQAAQVIAILKDPSVKEIHIADVAFAEVVWILGSPRIGYSRADVAELLSIVFKHPKVNCNYRLLEKVLSFYVKHPAISFVDACLATYAEQQGARLLTFDKKLARQHPYARLAEAGNKSNDALNGN
jgi:predicted nucleic-acid-binding protein